MVTDGDDDFVLHLERCDDVDDDKGDGDGDGDDSEDSSCVVGPSRDVWPGPGWKGHEDKMQWMNFVGFGGFARIGLLVAR